MRRFIALLLGLALVAAGCVSRSGGERFPGRLAYVRGGKVYIRAGSGEREAGFGHSPAWSPDGAWLAFVGSDSPNGPYTPRMVKADGTGLVTFPALQAENLRLAWSPTEAVLAVGSEHGLQLARPSGGTRTLVPATQEVTSFAWSHDGTRIAYVTTRVREVPPPLDTLWIVNVAEGSPVSILRDQEAGVIIADWWPDGESLLYWLDPVHSASIAADGLPLRRLDVASGASNHLETMLVNPRWISRAPDGQRFLAVTGGGRAAWAGKTLSVCDRQACRALPQPPGTVSLDGVWAPTGNRIAFVRAEARDPGASAAGWMETRRLWAAQVDGSGAQELAAAGAGVYSPQWANDGRHLLYARDGALWYLAIDGGDPVKLAEIDPPVETYYGQITAPVAWYQGR